MRHNLLLLSPHPDDLVFSAFSAVTEKPEKQAIEYFNVSKFTRWQLKQKSLVSAWRTLEDKIIMSVLNVKISYLFLEDSSVNKRREPKVDELYLKLKAYSKGVPRRVFCPLGVGGNPDHLLVRESAIALWLSLSKSPELCFYEDLPYAERYSGNSYSVANCVNDIEGQCGSLTPMWFPLSKEKMKQKLLFARAYFTQTDHRKLILQHGRKIGRECAKDYAEKCYMARSTKKLRP